MKNALILHGTNNNSNKNWFPWLKAELEKTGYFVWVPDLPQSYHPNAVRYNEFLLKNKDFQFNSETIIIGHSSGAVSILNLLAALPENTYVKACYLVGSFSKVLPNEPDWEQLRGLFEKPFDFKKIKSRSEKFCYFHSDDDPFCPLEQAKYLQTQTGGEFFLLPGQKHFTIATVGEKYIKFPELLEVIKKAQ